MKDGKILAFVGARGGSKGLPGKNLMGFSGKPMILWTLDALKQANGIDDLILSTDDLEIRDVCAQHGFDTEYLRPAHLADDHAKIGDAILHALEWQKEVRGKVYDYVLLAQPTSPLRGVAHINAAVDQYFKKRRYEDETLVSVYKAPPKTGWLTHQTDEGYLEFTFAQGEKQPRQRQKLDAWYYPNGALYLAPLKGFKGEFYSEHTQLYVMPEEVSADIDTLDDFERALEIKAGLHS